MTGDELERAIEFLLKNQAAFEARQAAFEARQTVFEAEREQTNQQIRELAIGQQHTQQNLASLTQIVTQNTQQINHINHVLLNVVEGQQRHSEEIDALIKLVGGVIERKNGKSES
jgi:chromosome segregation ATPase